MRRKATWCDWKHKADLGREGVQVSEIVTPVEVYFAAPLDIDAFAALLRDVLNLAPENRMIWQREQRRDGVNYGGLYYLFEGSCSARGEGWW